MSTPPATERPEIFRTHRPDVRADFSGYGWNLYLRLAAEWSQLANSSATRTVLRTWIKREACLAGATTLGEVLDRIDEASAQETDELLLALIRLFQSGQQLAGRLVLQAMLPKLARIVRSSRMDPKYEGRYTIVAPRHSDHDADLLDDPQLFRMEVRGEYRPPATVSATMLWEERRQQAVATFWEILGTYPVQTATSAVAGRLSLDTLHKLTYRQRRRREIDDYPQEPIRLEYLGSDRAKPSGQLPAPMVSDGADPDMDLTALLTWATAQGVLDGADADLLTRVYIDRQNRGDVARASGLTEAAIRKRCSRLTKKLAAAVRADMLGTTADAGAIAPSYAGTTRLRSLAC